MRTLPIALAITALVGAGAATWLLSEPSADVTPVVAPAVVRRQSIEFYERRLAEDPHSALDMASLAALYMDEGRLEEDERAFVKAESLARKSLGERTRRNGGSAALLVNALLAQHRFGEASKLAHELVEWDPETPAFRALLAETSMEIGDYRGAIAMLGSIRARRADLGIAPRFARWAELTGNTSEAQRILLAARDEAFRRSDLTPEQRAWFSVRLADFELRQGHVRGASQAIKSGLHESPGDWRLLLTSARLAVERGDWPGAIRAAEQVIAEVPSADAFALLARAHRELGHADEAAAFTAALEAVAFRRQGIHRTWAMALLDQGAAKQIVTAATSDTLVRHDIYTLDLLAWALHVDGRAAESLPLMRRAIALGSMEPVLRYHAGVIEAAVGEPSVAERHLTFALRGRRALSRSQASRAEQLIVEVRERTRN